MASEPRRYQAYLLRLWRVLRDDGEVGWRASLEDPHTGVRQGFARLDHLLAFLRGSPGGTPEPSAEAAQGSNALEIV